MGTHVLTGDLPRFLRETIVGLVRLDDADLTLRQFSVFLKGYLDEDNHTVSGLARELKIGKPAVTRALDRLEELDLARRVVDPGDRRRIFVGRTAKGAALLRKMRSMTEDAAVVPGALKPTW
jgi:DNA-binding MarR family transcriptional regulator